MSSLKLSSVFFALSVCVYGQAIVEYGLGVGRAGIAGGAAGKSTGKSIGAVFDKASKTLDNANAGKPSGTAPAPSAAEPAQPVESVKSATPPPPPAAAFDPAALTPGLEREELIAKFGKPSMKLTNQDGSDLVEKYWYRSAGRDTMVVTLRNGKVAPVSPVN